MKRRKPSTVTLEMNGRSQTLRVGETYEVRVVMDQVQTNSEAAASVRLETRATIRVRDIS